MRKTKGLMENGRILYLPIDRIHPNPSQPRKIFDPDALRELAASIEQCGIIQPLTVRRMANEYELVTGERRLRAAKMAGLWDVPCILLTVDEVQSGLVALVENLQRRDLDYIEEAQGLLRLMRQYGMSQEQAASKVGKSQSAVANKLRILRHGPVILEKLRANALSERHARALLRIESEEERLQLIDIIVRRSLNVAKTESLIESHLQNQSEPRRGFRKLILKDLRLFLNSVNHSLQLVRGAGFDAHSQQEETENEIILTIRLPKHNR